MYYFIYVLIEMLMGVGVYNFLMVGCWNNYVNDNFYVVLIIIFFLLYLYFFRYKYYFEYCNFFFFKNWIEISKVRINLKKI